MITKGQKINDRYEVIKTIGEGGMANVYLAHDIILDRDVAVKVLRGDLSGDEKFVRRFQREALNASSLSHPNIVEMYDVGEDNGTYFIVMEYVKGQTLKQLIKKRGALTLSEAIDIMLQLTDGLSNAHDSYIIHRDIKPQNIMIQDNGEIKITDFGIAIALNNTQLTQTNSVMGSVHYLPPEQASGKGATVKSDIYSMGIMFYELLTGELPFKGETAFDIAFKQIEEDIPSVREKNEAIPQSVENIVLKATAKNPKNRYNTAREMHDDLLVCLNEDKMNEPRIGFKYPEHEGNVKGKDKLVEQADKKDVKLEEDNEESSHSNAILWILSFTIIAIIIVMLVVFIILPSSTKTPDVQIPDVSNMTVSQAEEALNKLGFSVAPEIEKEANEEVEKGLVTKTSPSIGRKVKEGYTITLYVSSGKLTYTIEDYTGRNYIEVKTILENNYGLVVTIEKTDLTAEQKESGKFTEQTIVSQDLKEGTEVGKGKNITLYIPNIVTEYPDFTDGTYSREDIEAWCKANNIEVEFKYEQVAGYAEGEIISQSRAAGSNVVSGVSLRITIATVYHDDDAESGEDTDIDVTITDDSAA